MTTLEIKLAQFAGLLVAVVFGYFYIHNLHNTITSLNQEVYVLQGQVRDQNTSIENMAKAGKAREVVMKDLQEAAKVVSQVKQKQAQIIYKMQPSVVGDDCQSALGLVK